MAALAVPLISLVGFFTDSYMHNVVYLRTLILHTLILRTLILHTLILRTLILHTLILHTLILSLQVRQRSGCNSLTV